MRESAKGFESPEAHRGHDTEAHFTFLRHSQKASARIFDQGGGISVASISEHGIERAKAFGEDQFTDRDIDKAYATKVNRTTETLKAAFEAAQISPDILQKSDESKSFFSLPAQAGSKEYNQRYDAIMAPHREEYLAEHFPGQKFDDLNPDQQEEVAEYAEEWAMEWYLAFDRQRPDENTPSPREDAARVAFKINRLVNLPDYMPEGKAVDLVSAGHKTSTEAFLKYVIEQEKDGQAIIGFDSLSEIGGSLKILDSWDLDVKNNEGGKKTVKVTLRRENGKTETFDVNLQALHELSAEYLASQKREPNKIDSSRE